MIKVYRDKDYAYTYFDPQTGCNHPKRQVKVKEVLYENKESKVVDSFSVAELLVDNELRVGIRWNVSCGQANNSVYQNTDKICPGFPHNKGVPLWFLLPKNLDIYKKVIIPKLKEQLSELKGNENDQATNN